MKNYLVKIILKISFILEQIMFIFNMSFVFQPLSDTICNNGGIVSIKRCIILKYLYLIISQNNMKNLTTVIRVTKCGIDIDKILLEDELIYSSDYIYTNVDISTNFNYSVSCSLIKLLENILYESLTLSQYFFMKEEISYSNDLDYKIENYNKIFFNLVSGVEVNEIKWIIIGETSSKVDEKIFDSYKQIEHPRQNCLFINRYNFLLYINNIINNLESTNKYHIKSSIYNHSSKKPNYRSDIKYSENIINRYIKQFIYSSGDNRLFNKGIIHNNIRRRQKMKLFQSKEYSDETETMLN